MECGIGIILCETMYKNMDTLSHQGSGGDGSRDVPVRYERAIEH